MCAQKQLHNNNNDNNNNTSLWAIPRHYYLM